MWQNNKSSIIESVCTPTCILNICRVIMSHAILILSWVHMSYVFQNVPGAIALAE